LIEVEGERVIEVGANWRKKTRQWKESLYGEGNPAILKIPGMLAVKN